ncbi:unnamed protein product [Bursaphelenchus okinawaensis]|uniref:Uncharacterized protein n=1 Tax=Bursaphelenchus okinawaensis TaxID=465554 RepID=A0A811KCM8_9BILA|nr:unnamed protein product [Bursaphelenchus okinawaensis]CAG9097020.1 unnamed protein product [Bursaphelenchus okinawaensis]
MSRRSHSDDINLSVRVTSSILCVFLFIVGQVYCEELLEPAMVPSMWVLDGSVTDSCGELPMCPRGSRCYRPVGYTKPKVCVHYSWTRFPMEVMEARLSAGAPLTAHFPPKNTSFGRNLRRGRLQLRHPNVYDGGVFS